MRRGAPVDRLPFARFGAVRVDRYPGSVRGYDPGAHTCRFTGPDPTRRIARAPRSRDQRRQGLGGLPMRRGDRRDALPHAGRWQRRAPDPGDARWRQRHPDFSHDGTRLAVDHLANEQAADDLWIADSYGTDPKRIETTCPIDDCLGIWEPAWSPDDTQLAAVIFGGPLESDGPASFGVVIVDIATGDTRSVVQQPSAAGQIQFPRWSPDGNWLVFWNESDTPTAWIVGSDGKGLRALTDPELAAGDPDWSPDGSRILISTRPLLHFETGPTDLYAIAPDGTGLTKLTDSVSSLARYGQPRWSPDGMAILYTRTDRLPKIWARSLDGSVDGPIGATEVFQTHPVLQPTP